jgi:hypothetical protein
MKPWGRCPAPLREFVGKATIKHGPGSKAIASGPIRSPVPLGADASEAKWLTGRQGETQQAAHHLPAAFAHGAVYFDGGGSSALMAAKSAAMAFGSWGELKTAVKRALGSINTMAAEWSIR